VATILLACGSPAAFAQRADGAVPAGALDQTDETQHFDILEFRVLGNTLLARADIEAAVYPFLGPARDFASAEGARAALEQAYRTAGRATVYVDIPEQDVDAGIVRLNVTEGVLRRVRVEGARHFSARRIRAALPAAAQGSAPELPALQSELEVLNARTRDLNVVPILGAGAVPGTVDLTLKVKDELPLHGSVEVNDQYTADTSRLRANFAITYDNLFDRLDSLGLQYQTSPQSRAELGVLVASYTRDLGASRRLALYYVDSNSDVAALGTLSVLGKGKVYGARWIVPWASDAERSHTLSVGVDYKDFLENIRLDPASGFATPISYVNVSLGETSTWRDGERVLSLGGTLNFGPRRLGNSSAEFADKRFRARPNYFYLRGTANLHLPLPAGFALVAALAGQYAIEPVIGNEQFSIGGADSVRGFLEAEELGDIGIRGTLQFESPNLALARLRGNAFMFLDAAVASVIAPLPDEAHRADLSSWGAGLQFSFAQWLSGSLAWASPLVPGPRTAAGDSRLLFYLRTSW
jgi:hemolysin activation/secretion protein